MRDDLGRQLEELKIELRIGTSLTAFPPVAAGTATTFTVTTDTGEEITADIWFRSFGARVNTGYLEDGGLAELTDRRTVPVDQYLNVAGYQDIYAAGDIADLPDAKMATHAQTQAQVVVDNLQSQLRGKRRATCTNRPPSPDLSAAGHPRRDRPAPQLRRWCRGSAAQDRH